MLNSSISSAGIAVKNPKSQSIVNTMAAVRKGFKFTAKGAVSDDGSKKKTTNDDLVVKTDKRKVINDDVIVVSNKKTRKSSVPSDGK